MRCTGKVSPEERATLSSLALNERAGVTQAEREAVSRALDDDLERSKVPQKMRYLYLHNDTGQRLTVSLVYYTQDSKSKEWEWVPGELPKAQPFELTLAPGVTQQAKYGKEAILAFSARIWARNANNAIWDEWKNEYLLLVPEKDENGKHRYYANTHDTFTFRFIKK